MPRFRSLGFILFGLFAILLAWMANFQTELNKAHDILRKSALKIAP
jgi:hypothetical protein